MPRPPQYDVTFEDPVRTEIVTFSIVCQPNAYQCGADEFCEKLSTAALKELLPKREVFAAVVDKLKNELGCRISTESGYPVILASCTVEQFEKTFGGHLKRMIQYTKHGDFTREVRAIVLDPKAPPPQPPVALAAAGALLVTIEDPPLFANTPATIGAGAAVCVSLSDVASLTGADACHTFMLRSGELDKGKGITVAVVDTGFQDHQFFKGGHYNINRMSVGGAGPADEDPLSHGTFVLANLLACAPGVNAYGVKFIKPVEGVRAALDIEDIRVISLSFQYNIKPGPLSSKLAPLQMAIREAVSRGVTVVVAAGNWSHLTFPASMSEVIAVGGVQYDGSKPMTPWEGTSSYTTAAGRSVPDLCGVASDINLPIPPGRNSPAVMRCKDGETSCATPQVAGVAALLLQKNPSLTPADVKGYLMRGAARMIHTEGQPSTGAGLVNAINSLGLVP